jgi:hypothetical protein
MTANVLHPHHPVWPTRLLGPWSLDELPLRKITTKSPIGVMTIGATLIKKKKKRRRIKQKGQPPPPTTASTALRCCLLFSFPSFSLHIFVPCLLSSVFSGFCVSNNKSSPSFSPSSSKPSRNKLEEVKLCFRHAFLLRHETRLLRRLFLSVCFICNYFPFKRRMRA